MNWHLAKRHELYVIAFDDPYATDVDRLAAVAELKRRQKQKHGREQQKIRKEYPR